MTRSSTVVAILRLRTAAVVVAFLVMSTGGCAPYIHVYRYPSFQAIENVAVTKWTDDAPGTVVLSKEIPVAYALDRQQYTILISLAKEAFAPVVYVAARGAGGEAYLLEGDSMQLVQGVSGARPWQANEMGVTNVFRFLPPRPYDAPLRFRIIDSAGQVIAEELLPFELKKAGYSLEIDAI
jgi:hypothetical protein